MSAPESDAPTARKRIEKPPKRLWLVVGVALAIFTAVFAVTRLDLVIQGWFHDDEAGWTHAEDAWATLAYDFGEIPALIAGFGGLFLAVASVWVERLRSSRRLLLFLAVSLALGPGLIINGILKEQVGRPRPRHIEEFGGPQPFVAVGTLASDQPGKSFPSGHASMGFYWLGLAYYFSRIRRIRPAQIALAAGVLHGALMSLGRIAQGGHFFSDVVWSAGIVFFTAALVCDGWLLRQTRPKSSRANST